MRGIAAAVLLLAAAGCAATPSSPPVEDRWASKWVVPEEILGPRMAAFTCRDDPARPEATLNRWLDFLGERGVREREGGTARLRNPHVPERRESDYILRWRTCEEGIEVQVTDPSGLGGNRCRKALQSLAFAMEASGVYGEDLEPSGCLPPDDRPPGSRNTGEAIDEALREIGMVKLKDSPEQDANISWYGPPGGAREWHVDWIIVNGRGLATVELFHDAMPFDAKGERDLLARSLRLMGVVPWGLDADGEAPKPPGQEAGRPRDSNDPSK